MPTIPINVTNRAKTLDQRVQSQLKRCQSLDVEAQTLTSDRKSSDRMARGLFASDLINEAQSKLVECQLVAAGLSDRDDNAKARLAITERWSKSAIDLLNNAQEVLEDVRDIWGNLTPRGGLWDK
jgi:hypothetical protein